MNLCLSKNQRHDEISQFGAVNLLSLIARRIHPWSTLRPTGDSGARGSTGELAPPPIGAEFSPDMFKEFPDSTEFPFDVPEVYGDYMPVRTGSMRVPDIRFEGDLCNAEEGLVDTMQPPPAPCASALGVNGQLEAEAPLQAKGARWEPISAPAMPIKIVDEKEEHRHLIAAFDFPFDALIAELVSKTQRSNFPKPRQRVTRNGTSYC